MININKKEREILITQKLREGKGVYEAKEEVERDIEFIENLSEQKKQLQKEIKQMEKQKEKVSKEFKKQFEKLSKQKTKEPKEPMLTRRKASASTKHLNRILRFLEENPNSTITQIKNNCLITNEMANDGIRFLMNIGKVKELYRSDMRTYSLTQEVQLNKMENTK